ncbi:MAG: hypothetical protein V4692_05025, partial [Bdellovibrionota bacterium]
MSLKFYLEAMNCTACLWLLEKLPSLCPDVAWVRVNMSDSTIEISRTQTGSFASIARMLNRLGHRAHPLRESSEASSFRLLERRRDILRIGIAGAATGNIMILAVSVYAGASGILKDQFNILAAILSLPALTYCAWPFYKNALSGLRARHLNLDVPIVAALIAGIAMSVWSFIARSDLFYFDSLSMLVFLLLSSRLLLKSVQSAHLKVTNLEDDLLIGTVERIYANETTERVSSIALKRGDVIRPSENQMIPVDGTVIRGAGVVDTSTMTGESQPLEVTIGSSIEAGFRNLSGDWTLRVDRTTSESRLSLILRDTEQSALNKPRISLFADRVSQWFIGIVFALAGGIAISFALTDPQEGLTRALALIIVTCPCVFGMAIPLSLSLAVRKAARAGIVIKNP